LENEKQALPLQPLSERRLGGSGEGEIKIEKKEFFKILK